MDKLKVSFDFDGTLSREYVQKYAKELVEKGLDVYITTRRYKEINDYTDEFLKQYKIVDLKEQHRYLFEVADYCGIPEENIHFCNMEYKYKYLRDKGFLWHLDDDWDDLRRIQNNTKEVGISCFGNNTWMAKCNKMIEECLST